MNLKECEIRLTDINGKISELLKEREEVLKEWNTAFNNERIEDVRCIDKVDGKCHELYLANGDSLLDICEIYPYELDTSIKEFYRRIDNTIKIRNLANGRNLELPEWQKNLVYAKIAEIREQYFSTNEDK